MRVAAVDLGTNTTRLLVADIVDGTLDEVHRETRFTRLGEGVDARRRLLPVAIARVRNTLSDYRRTLESLGSERTLLVATSAVRDAENGEALLGEIEWSYGFATRLLSGEDEAAMTVRGPSASSSQTWRPALFTRENRAACSRACASESPAGTSTQLPLRAPLRYW